MSDTRPSIELFVRSLSPNGAAQQQEAILSRLDRLDERGVVDDYTVTIWGERIVPESLAAQTDTGREMRETVEQFRTWADERGVSLDRFFTDQTIHSAITGDRYSATALPVFAMAEYEDGELRSVTPHERDEGTLTVEDRLEALGEQATHKDGQPAAPVA
ncbi:MAG: HTH domain-containing protein [Haloarculaceae archaeon]